MIEVEKPDDWLSRREALAYSRGMLVEREAHSIKDNAFKEVMELLGCDSSTQYQKVPGMLRRILGKQVITCDCGAIMTAVCRECERK